MQPLSLYSAHAHPLLTTQCSKEFVSVTCCCLGSQCILNLGDAHDDACRHLFSRSGAGSLQSLDHLCSCSPCRFNSAAGAKLNLSSIDFEASLASLHITNLGQQYAALFTADTDTMRSFFAQQDHMQVFNFILDCLDFLNI